MRPLTEDEIRESFVNAIDSEPETLTLPVDVMVMEWADVDFVGWRDPRHPRRGYLVMIREDEPVGIVVRAAESSMPHRRSAICTLCRTPQPADQVALFTAPRAGQAGRNGNTIGTYICADLRCSQTARLPVPSAPAQVGAAATTRVNVVGTHRRLASFIDEVQAA